MPTRDRHERTPTDTHEYGGTRHVHSSPASSARDESELVDFVADGLQATKGMDETWLPQEGTATVGTSAQHTRQGATMRGTILCTHEDRIRGENAHHTRCHQDELEEGSTTTSTAMRVNVWPCELRLITPKRPYNQVATNMRDAHEPWHSHGNGRGTREGRCEHQHGHEQHSHECGTEAVQHTSTMFELCEDAPQQVPEEAPRCFSPMEEVLEAMEEHEEQEEHEHEHPQRTTTPRDGAANEDGSDGRSLTASLHGLAAWTTETARRALRKVRWRLGI